MFTKIYGRCQHCATEYSIFLYDKQVIGECKECGKEPIKTSPIKGLIYILHNEHQTGVKIGFTAKSLNQRIKALSSTGVPGVMKAVAVFHSNQMKKEESKVHEKLRKYRFDKEHFNLEPIEAVLATFRTLNRRLPVFYDKKVEVEFHARLAQARTDMRIKLAGKEDQ